MALNPFSGFRGRRYEASSPGTWEAFQKHHHGLGGPFMSFPNEPSPLMYTRFEWEDTPEAHVLKAPLPGLQSSDVRVEVDDDRVLCITSEKRVQKQEQRSGWHHMELSGAHYVQRLTLPHNSMLHHIRASMDNGLLTVTVPKLNTVPNNRIRNVNISSYH
ncbi:hypothetical protein VNO77_20444 [Canavalia gladiata]|uniref:SHSP domain-containing protein n=1 Tax=Canavalia gladiata TaxID=3824 RepID=A0AAN9LPF3_CANGL